MSNSFATISSALARIHDLESCFGRSREVNGVGRAKIHGWGQLRINLCATRENLRALRQPLKSSSLIVRAEQGLGGHQRSWRYRKCGTRWWRADGDVPSMGLCDKSRPPSPRPVPLAQGGHDLLFRVTLLRHSSLLP